MNKGNKRFYNLAVNGRTADIDIYGNIMSYAMPEYGEVSAANLSTQIKSLDVDVINVNINSYGGEVAEGLAIYNMLKRHNAKIITHVDGFACSIASVIFSAGDERVMSDASLLMIHNAWIGGEGDGNALRKLADDCDKITEASIRAYMDIVNITERQLKKMMDAETWLSPSEAYNIGFCTSIESNSAQNFTQSAQRSVFNIINSRFLEVSKDDDDDKACSAADEDSSTDEAENDTTDDDNQETSTNDAENDENADDSGDSDAENDDDSPKNADDSTENGEDSGDYDDDNSPKESYLQRFLMAIM